MAMEGEEAIHLPPFRCLHLSMCLVSVKLVSHSCNGFFSHLVCGQAFLNILEDSLLWPRYECGTNHVDLED